MDNSALLIGASISTIMAGAGIIAYTFYEGKTVRGFKKVKELDKLSKIAVVDSGTSIRMVEGDMYQLKRGLDCEDRIRRWLEKGANIELHVQGINQETRDTLEQLMSEYDRLRVFDLTHVPDKSEEEREFCRAIKTTHYALFSSPRQLWLERKHPNNDVYAYDCDYFNMDRMNRVKESLVGNFEELRQKFENLKKLADEIKL